jgi:hypothetical protein
MGLWKKTQHIVGHSYQQIRGLFDLNKSWSITFGNHFKNWLAYTLLRHYKPSVCQWCSFDE